MADLGFLPAVTKLLDMTPAGGQRMLFSATLDRGVARLVDSYLSDPAVHAVASDSSPVEAMDHQVFKVRAEDKLTVTAEVVARPGRTLLFVRTKHGADRLAKQLQRAGVDAGAIHGEPQPEPASAGPGCVCLGSRPRACRDRCRSSRHRRRGRRSGDPFRPAERPQGLPAPLRSDGASREHRNGAGPGTSRAGPQSRATALGSPGHSDDCRRTPGHEAVDVLATSGTPIVPDPRSAAGRSGGRSRATAARGAGRAAPPRSRAYSGSLGSPPTSLPTRNGSLTPAYARCATSPSAAWSRLWQWSIQMPGLSATKAMS